MCFLFFGIYTGAYTSVGYRNVKEMDEVVRISKPFLTGSLGVPFVPFMR